MGRADCARAIAVKLDYSRGRLTVETSEPRGIEDVLTRVLGVLTNSANGIPAASPRNNCTSDQKDIGRKQTNDD